MWLENVLKPCKLIANCISFAVALLSNILSPSQPVRWNWGLQSFKGYLVCNTWCIHPHWQGFDVDIPHKVLACNSDTYNHPGIRNHMYVFVCNYTSKWACLAVVFDMNTWPKKAYQTNKLLAITHLWFTVGIVSIYYLA